MSDCIESMYKNADGTTTIKFHINYGNIGSSYRYEYTGKGNSFEEVINNFHGLSNVGDTLFDRENNEYLVVGKHRMHTHYGNCTSYLLFPLPEGRLKAHGIDQWSKPVTASSFKKVFAKWADAEKCDCEDKKGCSMHAMRRGNKA